jgi:hypothetical protein
MVAQNGSELAIDGVRRRCVGVHDATAYDSDSFNPEKVWKV